MNENTKFDYYYGIEADQFSFYRVPRLLIKDERFKGLSSDAKLLYLCINMDYNIIDYVFWIWMRLSNFF